MRSLGALETEVMRHLWESSQAVSVREVMQALNDNKPGKNLAYTTVMTVMENLHRKGFLQREKHGRAFRYNPTLTREQHTAELIDGVLDRSWDRGAALMHFVERLTDHELADLREALKRIDGPEEVP